MAAVREVAFELECFEWAEERLEVAGRWQGLGPRRLNRPVLTVDTEGGRRKRIVAMPGGHLGAAGEAWRAAFAWPGDPVEITGAALEVGGNLVVDLPLPDRKRRRRRRTAAEPPGDEALRGEIAALRAQVERLRAELAGREREMIALRARLDEDTREEPHVARARADDRTVEVQRLAGELERLREEQAAGGQQQTVEIQRLVRERDEALAVRSADEQQRERDREAAERERERWRNEVDALREAFSDAAAEAEAARDRHTAELEALQAELRAERAEVARLSARLAAHTAPSGRRSAAAPSTETMPPPAAGPSAEALPPREAPAGPRVGEDATSDASTIEAAVHDAPGPLRAGSRPMTPPGADGQTRASHVPGWLRGRDRGAHSETRTRADADPRDERPGAVPATEAASGDAGAAGHSGPGALHALKDRFGGLFAANGHDAEREEPEPVEAPVPRPRRSATAARARAGATVAARRSPAEVWGMRLLAVFVVAVLLIALVLILTSIA